MPIISSQIVRNHDRGNGSLSIHEEHTDHIGKIHEHRYSPPIGYDVDLALADWVPRLDQMLIDAEINQAEIDTANGADPATLTFNHLTEAESVRAMMRSFLTNEAIDIKHMLVWVQSFSVPDLNALGFTTEERGQISAREGTINGVTDLLDTDSLFILDDF